MPNFIEEHREKPEVHNESIVLWEDCYLEYKTLSEECKKAFPFKDFYESQYKIFPRGGNMMHACNFELKNAIGKISLSYFDGLAKCIASLWIHKLDTYIQLNPMDKKKMIGGSMERILWAMNK